MLTSAMDTDTVESSARMVRCPLCEKPFKANSEEECVEHLAHCKGFEKRHGKQNNGPSHGNDGLEENGRQATIDTNRCNTCNKRGKMKKCTQCKSTYYCSKECQIQDWKKHKKRCKKA